MERFSLSVPEFCSLRTYHTLYRVDSKKRKKEKERKEGKNKRKKGEPDALSERKLGYLLVELAADLDHPKSNWILFVVLAMLG